jgi:hypothetical protein
VNKEGNKMLPCAKCSNLNDIRECIKYDKPIKECPKIKEWRERK